jgi:cell division transport system permease protein
MSRDGASQGTGGLVRNSQSWLVNHQGVAKTSLNRLLAEPLASLMTWLVIAIALALPAALYVSLQNIEAVTGQWQGNARISLYLQNSTSNDEGYALAKTLEKRPEIQGVEVITQEQALQEFIALSGYGDIVNSLDSNPLPVVLLVQPSLESNTETIKSLLSELQQQPQVAQAQLDLAWLERLHQLMRLGERIAFAIGFLLICGVLLIVGNTIRLNIENRRDEIVIVKLVGGTNAFVRRPFLYAGLWYGLGGGIIAWIIVVITLWFLSGPVGRLAGLYESSFSLVGLGLLDGLLLLLLAGAAGLGGAWIAVARHLGSIEPR